MLLLVLSSFICCKSKKDSPAALATNAAPPALRVEGMIASSQSLSANIEVPGTILAFETTEIHPEVSGRLVSLNIKEGTNVSQGALLAKLYDGDLQAQMRKLDVQLKIADQTEKRQAELLKIQGISQQEYDLSLLEVQSLKADKDIVQESIRKTEIKAPFSGKLGLKNVSPGAYVTPSTVMTSISQVNKLKIQFNVPERYGSRLKNGLTISFTVDGSSTTFTANIIATEIEIDENTRSLAVRALVNQQDKVLIPGTFAKVKIVLGENANALLVPNDAILPLGRKKQIYLYKAGKGMPTDITTGVRDSTNLEVVSGLKLGDTVITSGILFLRPGINVELSKIK
ncbi:MAG: efflux RND transporter periplasmic adaptor subunit [Saprospiraceae bacterium]|uniref:Efflux RND transporter periplasmic adaptor subunit n=1 Tax=Candidatus Opimibacter skivensis TaxID=2982028 RepID=A0A9D7SVC4_9BACT|nr:efflux RND transporter periplasmic adaptor subunit [Candidatus Opimibacter skivensis]